MAIGHRSPCYTVLFATQPWKAKFSFKNKVWAICGTAKFCATNGALANKFMLEIVCLGVYCWNKLWIYLCDETLDVSLEAVKGFLSSMVVILVSKIGNNSCFSFQVDDVKTNSLFGWLIRLAGAGQATQRRTIHVLPKQYFSVLPNRPKRKICTAATSWYD